MCIFAPKTTGMVKAREEVEKFISTFIAKADIFGVIFVDRDKNNEALKMLGLTDSASLRLVKEIKVEEYSDTISDSLSYGDMWIFGKDYNGKELYIKVSLGKFSDSAICVSFHIAQYQLEHPYKQ